MVVGNSQVVIPFPAARISFPRSQCSRFGFEFSPGARLRSRSPVDHLVGWSCVSVTSAAFGWTRFCAARRESAVARARPSPVRIGPLLGAARGVRGGDFPPPSAVGFRFGGDHSFRGGKGPLRGMNGSLRGMARQSAWGMVHSAEATVRSAWGTAHSAESTAHSAE